jgi:hypothetical protein
MINTEVLRWQTFLKYHNIKNQITEISSNGKRYLRSIRTTQDNLRIGISDFSSPSALDVAGILHLIETAGEFQRFTVKGGLDMVRKRLE